MNLIGMLNDSIFIYSKIKKNKLMELSITKIF